MWVRLPFWRIWMIRTSILLELVWALMGRQSPLKENLARRRSLQLGLWRRRQRERRSGERARYSTLTVSPSYFLYFYCFTSELANRQSDTIIQITMIMGWAGLSTLATWFSDMIYRRWRVTSRKSGEVPAPPRRPPKPPPLRSTAPPGSRYSLRFLSWCNFRQCGLIKLW